MFQKTGIFHIWRICVPHETAVTGITGFFFLDAAIGSINTTDGTQVSEEQGDSAQCNPCFDCDTERESLANPAGWAPS